MNESVTTSSSPHAGTNVVVVGNAVIIGLVSAQVFLCVWIWCVSLVLWLLSRLRDDPSHANRRQSHSFDNATLQSCVLSSFLPSVVILPFWIQTALSGWLWPYGSEMCVAWQGADLIHRTAAAWNIAWIIFGEFVSLKKPRHACTKFLVRYNRMCHVLVWLVVVTMTVTVLSVTADSNLTYDTNRRGWYCLLTPYNSATSVYFSIVSYFLPSFIALIIYVFILKSISIRYDEHQDSETAELKCSQSSNSESTNPSPKSQINILKIHLPDTDCDTNQFQPRHSTPKLTKRTKSLPSLSTSDHSSSKINDSNKIEKRKSKENKKNNFKSKDDLALLLMDWRSQKSTLERKHSLPPVRVGVLRKNFQMKNPSAYYNNHPGNSGGGSIMVGNAHVTATMITHSHSASPSVINQTQSYHQTCESHPGDNRRHTKSEIFTHNERSEVFRTESSLSQEVNLPGMVPSDEFSSSRTSPAFSISRVMTPSSLLLRSRPQTQESKFNMKDLSFSLSRPATQESAIVSRDLYSVNELVIEQPEENSGIISPSKEKRDGSDRTKPGQTARRDAYNSYKINRLNKEDIPKGQIANKLNGTNIAQTPIQSRISEDYITVGQYPSSKRHLFILGFLLAMHMILWLPFHVYQIILPNQHTDDDAFLWSIFCCLGYINTALLPTILMLSDGDLRKILCSLVKRNQ